MTAFDPEAILRTLDRHGVAFVVIGGIAAAFHGSPEHTYDLDVCYARDDDNLTRLAAALQELHARLRGVDDDVPFLLDAKTLGRGDCFTFVTDHGSFDILGTPSGSGGFEALHRTGTDVEIGALVVRIAGVDELIDMKRAAGRSKDQRHLEILGALRDEIEGRGA